MSQVEWGKTRNFVIAVTSEQATKIISAFNLDNNEEEEQVSKVLLKNFPVGFTDGIYMAKYL